MWDLIVSVPDHCLSFYFIIENINYGGKYLESFLLDIFNCIF